MWQLQIAEAVEAHGEAKVAGYLTSLVLFEFVPAFLGEIFQRWLLPFAFDAFAFATWRIAWNEGERLESRLVSRRYCGLFFFFVVAFWFQNHVGQTELLRVVGAQPAPVNFANKKLHGFVWSHAALARDDLRNVAVHFRQRLGDVPKRARVANDGCIRQVEEERTSAKHLHGLPSQGDNSSGAGCYAVDSRHDVAVFAKRVVDR